MLLVNEANYRFLPYEFEAEGHFVDTNANPDLSPCSRKSAVFTNDTNTTHSASWVMSLIYILTAVGGFGVSKFEFEFQ